MPLPQQPSSPVAEASADSVSPLPKYGLNINISTVFNLWREWSVDIGNGPSVSTLNDTYGSGWRVGWLSKERHYYSQRLAIIDHVYRLSGVDANGEPLRSHEEVAKQLDEERGRTGLDGLTNKTKKEMRQRGG